MLVRLRAQPEDMLEVQLHVAVLGRDLVPALAAEGVLELAELLVADAEPEGRARLEADADALGHVGFSVLPPAGRSRSARRPPSPGARRRRASRGSPAGASRRCAAARGRATPRAPPRCRRRDPRRGAAPARGWPGSGRRRCRAAAAPIAR